VSKKSNNHLKLNEGGERNLASLFFNRCTKEREGKGSGSTPARQDADLNKADGLADAGNMGVGGRRWLKSEQPSYTGPARSPHFDQKDGRTKKKDGDLNKRRRKLSNILYPNEKSSPGLAMRMDGRRRFTSR